MSSTPTLAPEAMDGVQAALDKLEQHTARLTATGDPLADVVAASAAATKATIRLIINASLTQQAHSEAMAQALQEVRKPWSRDEIRMLVTQMRDSLMHLWVGFNHWGIAIGVASSVLFGGACAVGGYLFHGSVPELAGLRAGAEQCQDYQDGSRLCRIPVWERLPPRK